MDTYFIRHTQELAISDSDLDKLYNDAVIAVHYPHQRDGKLGAEDNESLEPSDYTTREGRVVRAMVQLARDGGYVCAEYRGKADRLLGVIAPGTQITLARVPWREEDRPGRAAVLKTLPLQRVMHVSDRPALFVGRPKQGTISRWTMIGGRVADLVEGRPERISLDALSTAMQEVMCSEFLRLERASELGLPRLRHLVLLGRTMRDLDIVGLTADDEELFGQVTFTYSEEKLRQLANYQKPGRHLVLFCDTPECGTQRGVTVFPIRRVFEEFIKSPNGPSWFRCALGT